MLEGLKESEAVQKLMILFMKIGGYLFIVGGLILFAKALLGFNFDFKFGLGL